MGLFGGGGFSSFTSSISDAVSNIGSAGRDVYSNVRDQATLKNLSIAAPYTLLTTSSGREQLINTYGPYAGALQQLVSGNPSGAIGAASNVLSSNPDSPSWLSGLLGGNQPVQKPANQENAAPLFLSGLGQQAQGLPSWAIPAMIGAGVLVLVLVLRK